MNNKQTGRPNLNSNQNNKFNNKSDKKGGFGERMGVNNRSASTNDYKKKRENNGTRNNYQENENDTPKTQKGNDWIEDSKFCRANLRTGELKWKEEFWTNKESNIKMCEAVSLKDKRPLGFQVPSIWKFQNVEPSHFNCERCNKKFIFESALITHSKFRNCDKIKKPS